MSLFVWSHKAGRVSFMWDEEVGIGVSPDFYTVYLVLRDIDKVDELMADITEQQELAQQISDAISRPVGFGEDMDEVTGGKGSGTIREAMRLARRNAQEKVLVSLEGNFKSVLFESWNSFSWSLTFLSSHIQDELLEELEELEQEELAQELLNVGNEEEEPPVKLPSVPSTHLPAGPGTQGYLLSGRLDCVGT